MSVESKIKELLGRIEAKASLDEADQMGAGSVSKDSSIKPANSGDASSPKQGDSEDASYETRDEKEENQGAKVSKGISKNNLTNSGPGATPNFTTTMDLQKVVNMPAASGNKPMSEEEAVEGETVESEEETTEVQEPAAIDLSPIFGADLSEDFKEKATSIFEAAVIARVNYEMEKVTESLEEKFEQDFEELRESMVEKVDSYLNYVVEQYMKENALAIENGLRTEIAEDFIEGLKNLFKEHYVEVPEDKYDVIGELQDKAEELEAQLDEAISTNVELNAEVAELKRNAIIEELSKDLADTEAAKLRKLVEGVSFDEETYTEKVSVIKENYFPKNKPTQSTQQTQAQPLIEDTSESTENTVTNSTVDLYAKALSRSIKRA
jgi:hypothetical protein